MPINKKIIFRADGNSQTGLGHLYRCFALVEIYKDSFDVYFLTRSDSTKEVIPEAYNITSLPNSLSLQEEVGWISENYSPKEYIILADGYQFDETYQKQLKANNYTLIYIDDLKRGHQYADIIINHSPLVTVDDYDAEVYTKFALGTEYAILRPLFLESTKNKPSINQLDTCFICFGGADMHNLSLKASQALLEIEEIKEINIVIGAAYRHNKLFELSKQCDKLNIYQNISEKELISIMQKSNIAIAPASTICYEVCAVKMPLIGGYYIENQKDIYKGLLENKVILDGGNFENYSINDFKILIKKLIKENNPSKYVKNQSKMFDSEIKARFLQLLT